MSQADYYAPGDYNAQCYECGRKFKASMLRRYWQGYYLCPDHWNERQPQDFARAVRDVQTPPWSQPMPQWKFNYFCTPNGRTAIADYAVAGCAIAGFRDPAFDADAVNVA